MQPHSLIATRNSNVSKHFNETAVVIWRKAGPPEVSMPPNVLRRTRAAKVATMVIAIPKGGANTERQSQLGFRVATHPDERGILSNRHSSNAGEYGHRFCTHRPSLEPRSQMLRSSPAGWIEA